MNKRIVKRIFRMLLGLVLSDVSLRLGVLAKRMMKKPWRIR